MKEEVSLTQYFSRSGDRTPGKGRFTPEGNVSQSVLIYQTCLNFSSRRRDLCVEAEDMGLVHHTCMAD